MMMYNSMWAIVEEQEDGGRVWKACEADNREGSHYIGNEIILAAVTFPVGTKIEIFEPMKENDDD